MSYPSVRGVSGATGIAAGLSPAAVPEDNKPFLWLISITGIPRGVNIFTGGYLGFVFRPFFLFYFLKAVSVNLQSFTVSPFREYFMSS
jgi:hypothetical protein